MTNATLSNAWFNVRDFVSSHKDTYPFISPLKANLAGKSVLITGASKGIGRATAVSFSQAGCSRIALAARSPVTEIVKELEEAAAKSGRSTPTVLALHVDVTSEESVKDAAAQVTKVFDGKLDILINNAGYLEEWKPVGESDPTDWWASWEVNMKGMYLCCRFFMPLLLKSDMKTILNVSSAGAHNVSHGASAYQTSKFAGSRFTEFLESEYRSQGLVAISVRPGGVRTELGLNMPKEFHAILTDTPELPGDTMAWLCRERREWLSGRFVNANWDMEEMEARKQDILDGDLLRFRMAV